MRAAPYTREMPSLDRTSLRSESDQMCRREHEALVWSGAGLHDHPFPSRPGERLIDYIRTS